MNTKKTTKPVKPTTGAVTVLPCAKGFTSFVRLTIDGKRQRISPRFVAKTEGEAEFLAIEWNRKNIKSFLNSETVSYSGVIN
jgi:hypothetical protein